MAKNKLAGVMASKAVDYPTPCAPPRRTKEDQERERRYRAEEALRTLSRAEECKRDRQLMADVRRLAAEQVKNLQSVTKGGPSRR